MAVYFIQHGKGGDIKIGTTTSNPHVRMARLQTGTPIELKLLVAAPGGPSEEQAMHQRFAALHVRGEWFRAEASLLGFIEGLLWAYRDQQPEPEPEQPTLFGMTHEQFEAIRGAQWMNDLWRRAWLLVSVGRGVLHAAGLCIECRKPRDTGMPETEDDQGPWCKGCRELRHGRRWVGLGGGSPPGDPAKLAKDAAPILSELRMYIACADDPSVASAFIAGANFSHGIEELREACEALMQVCPPPNSQSD